MTPNQLRGRIGGLTVAARGTVNTAPARAAFESRWARLVDPDGLLPDAERAKRAAALKAAHFTRLALKSAVSRRRAAGTPTRKEGNP